MTDIKAETNPVETAETTNAGDGESSSTLTLDETESTADSTTKPSDAVAKDAVESSTVESPTTESDPPRVAVSPSPPPRPPKRARTAYFIFADSVRQEVQQDHQGVAAQAKAIGAKWKTLDETQKDKFKQLAQQEKEAAAKALQEYEQHYGSHTTLENSQHPSDANDLVFPVARIRKIAKLDPEVKTLSKEALQLVVKSAELALSKLGKESVKVARLENRRTLMAQDVAHVCAHREAFRFLKDDIKDLTKLLLQQKQNDDTNTHHSKTDAMVEAAAGTKPLTSYFGAAKK